MRLKWIVALILILNLNPVWLCELRSQTQTVILIDKKVPVVVEAPFPFIEVSRSLPEAFAEQQARVGAANRLVAYFIPRGSLPDQLTDKPGRIRTLKIQLEKSAEPARHTPADLQKQRDELHRGIPNLTPLSEDKVDTLFSIMDLGQFGKKVSARKILGLANLGPDSFTLCMATSAEGKDLFGGRRIEASVSCVSHVLIKEKILLLTVTCPDITPDELSNAMRLTREWITLLRAENP